LPAHEEDELPAYRLPIVWALLRHLGTILHTPEKLSAYSPDTIAATSGAWIREWFLRKPIAQCLAALGVEGHAAALEASLVRIGIAHASHMRQLEAEIWGPVLEAIFGDPDVQFYLRVNRWQGRRWLNREHLQSMTDFLQLALAIPSLDGSVDAWDQLAMSRETAETLMEAAEGTNFDLDWMLSALK